MTTEAQSDVTVPLDGSYIQLLFPEQDHSETWRVHKGLAGHLGYRERIANLSKVHQQIKAQLAQATMDPTKVDILERIASKIRFFRDHFGDPTYIAQIPGKPAYTLNYHMITGYSRSGGTYLTSEYAKMRGYDLLKTHIYWSHDFAPLFSLDMFRTSVFHENREQRLRNGMIGYLANMLTHIDLYKRNNFFRRTTLGAAFVPYLDNLSKNGVEVNLIWRHGIRDIFGLYQSLTKMYAEYEEVRDENLQQLLVRNYGEATNAKTPFGTVLACWYINNLTALPVIDGLPFFDVPVTMMDPPDKILRATGKLMDTYLSRFKAVGYRMNTPPKILKFGPDFVSQLEDDAKALKLEGYTPGAFNYSEKKTIDDPYVEVYGGFLEQITKAYQHFGLDFDGKLERY